MPEYNRQESTDRYDPGCWGGFPLVQRYSEPWPCLRSSLQRRFGVFLGALCKTGGKRRRRSHMMSASVLRRRGSHHMQRPRKCANPPTANPRKHGFSHLNTANSPTHFLFASSYRPVWNITPVCPNLALPIPRSSSPLDPRSSPAPPNAIMSLKNGAYNRHHDSAQTRPRLPPKT